MRDNTVPDVITWEFASHPITNVGCVRPSMRETFLAKLSETTVGHLTLTLMKKGKNKEFRHFYCDIKLIRGDTNL